MDYISNSKKEIDEMLRSIGVQSPLELFKDVPKNLMLPEQAEDDGLSEMEAKSHMETLAQKNNFHLFDSYQGGGAYDHFIPSFIKPICQKSEFLTSYTPYQAEASQGMLQVLFEYQSAALALTGLDVSNASVYDGASAAAESALMALRHKKGRNQIIVFESVNPLLQKVISQYLIPQGFEIIFIACDEAGRLNLEDYKKNLNESIAAVLIQSPNFFGRLEDARTLFQEAKAFGALSILISNPVAYGLFPSAKELGADIAAGDMQPFGNAMQFGGPYSGYITCTTELMRELPGRIVGETVDTQGKRGFILTLQAREQHIRREKATSNICTSQSLTALSSLLALLWYGKEGLKKLAETNYKRANFLKNQLMSISKLKIPKDGIYFNEFPVIFPGDDPEIFSYFMKDNIIPGLSISSLYSGDKKGTLVTVTEKKSLEMLQKYIAVASQI